MRSRVPRMLLVHPEKDPQSTHKEALGSNARAVRSVLSEACCLTLGWVTLLWGCPAHCGMVSHLPELCPLDIVTTTPSSLPGMTTTSVSGPHQVSPGGEISPVENHCPRGSDVTFSGPRWTTASPPAPLSLDPGTPSPSCLPSASWP